MQTALILFEYIFVSLFSVSVHFASTGHVCRVRQLWKGCGRAVAGVRPVRPVLPSLLCEQQSRYFILCLWSTTLFGFCGKTDTDLNVLCRSRRRSFVRAGAAWNASSAKCVGRRRTPPGFCCATTVTSAIIPTALTHRCTMSQRAVGSANGTNT